MAFLKELFALFLLIVAVVILNPSIINDLYDNILGRIVLIAIILFFTMHNTTLGLLVALCLIAASNQFFGVNKMRIEGFSNSKKRPLNPDSIYDDDLSPSRNDASIKSLDSASIQVSKDLFSSANEVMPMEEGFQSLYSIII
jgi:thiol:disulfide interchange protein